jgi:hypothetical protein
MSFATKRILACILLVAVCIWPMAHYGLVRALDLNPWKWFGWAMYTVPPMRVRARAISVEDGRQLDLTDLPRDVAGRVLLAYERFSGPPAPSSGRTPPSGRCASMSRTSVSTGAPPRSSSAP